MPTKELKMNFIVLGIYTGLAFGFFFGFFCYLVMGSSAGFASGVPFGLTMGLFAKFMSRRLAMNPPQELAGQTIVVRGPANHFKGMEGRGGFLYITESHMYFQPHEVNLQREPISIPLEQVEKVSAMNALGIIPNSIRIHLTSGESHRFVVYQRDEWIKAIEAHMPRQAA